MVLAIVVPGATVLVAPSAQANGCITPAAGTAEDPYIIATQSNLNCLRGNDMYWGRGKHFRQTAHLDMTNYGPWVNGIGSDDTAFSGTYDGNGFTISNLTIDDSTLDKIGMFDVTSGSTLQDITLVNLRVRGKDQVGGLVGIAFDDTISQVYVEGVISGVSGVGGLIGVIGAMGPTTITQATVDDSSTVTGSGMRVGGLIGFAETETQPLTIADVQASGESTGLTEVGGLIGSYVDSSGNQTFTLTDSYASGLVTATQSTPDGGGLVGCFYDDSTYHTCALPYGGTNVIESYWDTQTTGQATTAGSLGTGRTTAQMTAPGTFAFWSIAERAPANTTWGICPTLNGGYPFLQWVAAQKGWTCTSTPTPPAPAAPIPATPPTGVAAQAGDASASVSWSAPASSGSYAVSTYLVRSSPDGQTCLTPTLSCTVTDLRNGTPYTFTVQALTGAGWSSPSAASAPVVPVKARSIVIAGTRSGNAAVISGAASGLEGKSLTVLVRLRGEKSFTERGTVTPDARGAFTWRIRTGKTVHAFVSGDDAVSNRVVIARG